MSPTSELSTPRETSEGNSESTLTVTSQDGTVVIVRRIGHGPSIVVLHGAMETARSHSQLASALGDSYSVCLVERRGHALGYPFSRDYGMRQEVADVRAVLEKTGAHFVFGVSSGGLVALAAALDLPAVHKVAVYEPALFVDGAPEDELRRYDHEIAEGKTAAALVTGMKAAQMGPALVRRIPRSVLEAMTSRMLRKEGRTAARDDVTMTRLAPTLHYDFELVIEGSGRIEELAAVSRDVLLLGGSKSPGYLKGALDRLEQVLPHAERVTFAGLDHGGSSDVSQMNRSGDPERVARELRRFFG